MPVKYPDYKRKSVFTPKAGGENEVPNRRDKNGYEIPAFRNIPFVFRLAPTRPRPKGSQCEQFHNRPRQTHPAIRLPNEICNTIRGRFRRRTRKVYVPEWHGMLDMLIDIRIKLIMERERLANCSSAAQVAVC